MRNPDLSDSADVAAWLTVSAAPLAGLALSLVTLWAFAIPRPLHTINLAMGPECPQDFVQRLTLHTVVIDSSNRFIWDGKVLDSREAMETSMKTLARKYLSSEVAVRVEAHRLADYGSFIAVLASAQRNGIARVDVMGGARPASAFMCPVVPV